MDLAEKKAFLADQFREKISNPVKRLHFAWDAPVADDHLCYPHPPYRLTLQGQGQMDIEAAFDNRVERRIVTSGEAVFFRRFAWHNVKPGGYGTVLAIVYQPDFLRVVWGAKAVWVNNPYPIGSAGRHVLQALDSFAKRKSCDHELCSRLVGILLELTLQDFMQGGDDIEGSIAFDTWLQVKQYLSEHFSEEINRNTVAADMGLSPGYLSQLFQRFCDDSFLSYLNRLRLSKAEYLLRNTGTPLKMIAALCGFSGRSRFTKVFTDAYGTSPGKFRKLARNISVVG